MRKHDGFDLTWRRYTVAAGIALASAGATIAGPRILAAPGMAWPPAGVLLAILLVAGMEAWLPAAAGVFVGAAMATGSEPAAVILATAATAQAAAGAWLVNRYAGGLDAFAQTRNFARFAVLTGVVAAAVGPLIGGPAFHLTGRAPYTPATAVALSWWLTDGVSSLVIVPCLVMWRDSARFASLVPKRRLAEGLALTAALAVTWAVLFGPWWPAGVAREPFRILGVPALLWAAYRFGPRIAALAVIGLALVVLAATSPGVRPFVALPTGAALVAADVFIGVCAVTTLALALVTRERRAAERSLEALARTDGLTGLANYRAFLDTLDDEVARAGRKGHGFSLLFVDLDRLKLINDTHGHLAGNRAIVRVARALAANCRAMDTAARVGGDEFCILLPQTGLPAARLVADRVRRSLASNTASPRVDVSWGVATFPGDGVTGEQMLAAADRLLYTEKSRRVPQAPAGAATR